MKEGVGNSDIHCLQPIVLMFKSCQPQNKRIFVSTAIRSVVGTLMTINDVTVNIAIGGCQSLILLSDLRGLSSNRERPQLSKSTPFITFILTHSWANLNRKTKHAALRLMKRCIISMLAQGS